MCHVVLGGLYSIQPAVGLVIDGEGAFVEYVSAVFCGNLSVDNCLYRALGSLGILLILLV